MKEIDVAASPVEKGRQARRKHRDHPLIQALPGRIRDAAQSLRISSGELAERIGVSDQTVISWWNGVNVPPLEMLVALAEALDMRPASFLEPLDTRKLALSYHLAMITSLASGRSLPEAFEEVVGHSELLPEHAIAALERISNWLRRYLDQEAGGRYLNLSVFEQEEVRDRLLELGAPPSRPEPSDR